MALRDLDSSLTYGKYNSFTTRMSALSKDMKLFQEMATAIDDQLPLRPPLELENIELVKDLSSLLFQLSVIKPQNNPLKEQFDGLMNKISQMISPLWNIER